MLLLWKLVFSYYTHAFKISVEQYGIQNQFAKADWRDHGARTH